MEQQRKIEKIQNDHSLFLQLFLYHYKYDRKFAPIIFNKIKNEQSC